MWIILGFGAIIAAIINVILTLKGKDGWALAYISLSLTALTLCAFHSMSAYWVAAEYWSALMDVVPTLSNMLWTLTGASILINGICFLKR